jgi:hypothetical protein
MLTLEERATNAETLVHIGRVRTLLNWCVLHLLTRGEVHDQSKLEPPEVSVFTEFTPKLKNSTYGSDEYKGFLQRMKPALDHHYAKNDHHPEFWRWNCPICNGQFDEAQHEVSPQGPNDSGDRYCPKCCSNGMLYESQLMLKPGASLNGMSLMSVMEMLADWKAASERHHDGCLMRSIEINTKRFNISEDVACLLRNTAIELGWAKPNRAH